MKKKNYIFSPSNFIFLQPSSFIKRMSAEVPEKTAPAAPETVPIKLRIGQTVTAMNVPVDADFKACRTAVFEGRAADQKQAAEESAGNAEVPTQISIEFASALSAAVEDCETMIAKMRALYVDGTDSELFLLSQLTAAHYDEWKMKQGAMPIDPESAPLYVARMHRSIDETPGVQAPTELSEIEQEQLKAIEKNLGVSTATEAASPWTKPQLINLRGEQIQKIFDAATIKLFTDLRMYKNAARVLIAERAFQMPDGTQQQLTYCLIYAIEGDFLAELRVLKTAESLAAAAAAGGESPPTPMPETESPPSRAIVVLQAQTRVLSFIGSAKDKTKEETEAEGLRRHTNYSAGMALYEKQREQKRSDRLCVLTPAIVAASVALFSIELARCYDILGVKVPQESIILSIQVRDGILHFDQSRMLRHSDLRNALEKSAKRFKKMEAQIKAISDPKSAVSKRLWFEFTAFADEHNSLVDLDRLASDANTRNQIVFSITDIGTGIDANRSVAVRFTRTIDVKKLVHRTQQMLEKEKQDAPVVAGTTAAVAAPAPVPSKE